MRGRRCSHMASERRRVPIRRGLQPFAGIQRIHARSSGRAGTRNSVWPNVHRGQARSSARRCGRSRIHAKRSAETQRIPHRARSPAPARGHPDRRYLLGPTHGAALYKQIELVTTFADQAVIAIENARLFDEVQARTRELTEALERQTATSEVLQVISSSPGVLEPVFQAILENATKICQAKFGGLYLCDGDAFRAAAFHNAPPAFVEQRMRGVIRPGPNTALGRAARTK